jgi:hypothetical protein
VGAGAKVARGGSHSGRNRTVNDRGVLQALDNLIMRHGSAISVVTGLLAILGVGAMAIGLANVSPLLKVLSPF